MNNKNSVLYAIIVVVVLLLAFKLLHVALNLLPFILMILGICWIANKFSTSRRR